MRGYRGGFWEVLGIEPTTDVAAIRRAYARLLRQTQPEDDPEGFEALRAAYDQAMNRAAPRRSQAAGIGPVRMSRRSRSTRPDPPDGYDEPFEEPEDEPPLPPPPAASAAEPVEPAAPPRPRRQPPPAAPTRREPTQAELDARAMAEARRRLTTALDEAVSDPAKAARITEALDALLAAPFMGSLEAYGWNETWLAQLIMSDRPGVEHLADPAARFFGWDNRRLGPAHDLAHRLSWRLEELRTLLALTRPGSPFQRAWLMLQKQPAWRRVAESLFNVGIVADVHNLLEKMDRSPALLSRLDPQAVDWWRRRVSRPTFPAAGVWLAMLGAFLGFVSALASGDGDEMLQAVGGAMWVVVPVSLWIWGLAWPTARWRQAWSVTAPDWVRLGWAPAAAALVLLSAVAPVLPGAAWLFAPFLTAVALWALIVGVTDPQYDTVSRWPTVRRFTGLLGHIPILLFWWLMTPFGGPHFLQMLAAVFTAAFVHACGHGGLLDRWSRLGRAVQTRAIGGMVGLVAAANLLVWTPPAWRLWEAGAALATIALLMSPTPMRSVAKTYVNARAWVVAGLSIAALVVISALSDAGGRLPLGVGLKIGVALVSSLVLMTALGWWNPWKLRDPQKPARRRPGQYA